MSTNLRGSGSRKNKKKTGLQNKMVSKQNMLNRYVCNSRKND